MVELEDDVYAKLQKDANDNRQVVNVTKWLVILVMFFVIFFSWGRKIINFDVQRRQAELDCQIALIKAENNVEIREIESSGIDFDDYIKWLIATKK